MPTKIVFLDRDGTLNKLKSDYVKNLTEFEILPSVGTNLKKLSDAGFSLIVITNQSAINRKFMTMDDLTQIHNVLDSYLKSFNCKLDGIYFCPHTPDEQCMCRKPNTGLIKNALENYSQIDLEHSWFIGDSESDIQAGKKFGLKTIKIKSDDSLDESVNYILKNSINNN